MEIDKQANKQTNKQINQMHMYLASMLSRDNPFEITRTIDMDMDMDMNG